ncbi:MAG: hypothetical protein MI724_21375, partial [Spirochaetales bacterium]|nr:hypothetical protein [Spirochaetales bacterium]
GEITTLLDGIYAEPRIDSSLRRGAIDLAAVTLLRDQRGRPVGCAVPTFDLSPALRRASGYVGLRTAIDLCRERRRTGRRVVDGLTVSAADHESDVARLLLTGLLRRLARLGADEVVITDVPSSATAPWSDAIGPAGRICARYRVYGRAV